MVTLANIEKEIYSYEYKKIEENYFILDKEKYASEKTRLILKFSGIERCSNCDEKFNNIDISDYLKIIRNQEKESSIILAIQGDQIQDSIIVPGDYDKIHADSYFERNEKGVSAVEFINYWHNKKAQLCNYHNHPLQIAAIPSNEDINSFDSSCIVCNQAENEWGISAKNHGIDIPINFKYDDWGVVTFYDFFSCKQSYQKSKNALAEIKNQNDLDNKEADLVLKKYTVYIDDD